MLLNSFGDGEEIRNETMSITEILPPTPTRGLADHFLSKTPNISNVLQLHGHFTSPLEHYSLGQTINHSMHTQLGYIVMLDWQISLLFRRETLTRVVFKATKSETP